MAADATPAAQSQSQSQSQSPARAPSPTQPIRRSWTSSALNLQRRQSSNDRVNEILENARERAQSMENDPAASVARSRRSNGGAGGDGRADESADETTNIMDRDSGPNYQATQATQATQAEPGLGPNKGRARTRMRVDDGAPRRDSEHGDRASSRWWTKFRSIELENKGSVARDHLALERTFLAWLRTSLAFASIGVAVTQLFRLNTSLEEESLVDHTTLRQMGRPLGTVFLGASIVTLLLGYKRYHDAQQWIMRGKFPASRGTIAVTALMAFAIIVMAIVVAIVLPPPAD